MHIDEMAPGLCKNGRTPSVRTSRRRWAVPQPHRFPGPAQRRLWTRVLSADGQVVPSPRSISSGNTNVLPYLDPQGRRADDSSADKDPDEARSKPDLPAGSIGCRGGSPRQPQSPYRTDGAAKSPRCWAPNTSAPAWRITPAAPIFATPGETRPPARAYPDSEHVTNCLRIIMNWTMKYGFCRSTRS